MRVYLIDGYSLLYRAFYALPQSIATSSGLPTNALYGFTSMVLKLLDSEEEVGIGVVWDSGKPAFRMEIFPEYKAHRSAMPEELKVQLDHLDEILDEYGVTPEQIPDYKALVGDPSDNIPGVRGIGPKGAANLLQQFGSVQGIYENLDKISAKGTRAKLEEGRESAFVSLELAKMRFDAPVDFDKEALRFEGVGVAPVGDGRWAAAGAEDEAALSDGLPDRPLRVHDAKKLGVGAPHFDTFLAAYLIKPGLGSYELDALAAERGLAEVAVDHEDPALREAARRAATIHA